MRGRVHARDDRSFARAARIVDKTPMARSAANVKSGDVPLRGGAWAALLALVLIAGLAMTAKYLRADRQNSTKLDTIVKSTAPLPTPVPIDPEEMDPDKQ